jgi:hypothetical protein
MKCIAKIPISAEFNYSAFSPFKGSQRGQNIAEKNYPFGFAIFPGQGKSY